MHAAVKTFLAVVVGGALTAQALGASQGPIAFAGAEGFGAVATGGRGGEVYHVTNLNDSGQGSFRDAVSAGHRTVVFDVGGVITLKSPVSIASDITIAGQTAPGEGITVYNNACSVTGRSNVIIRYMRFRAGIASARGAKTLGINASHDIIFDHVTMSWGRWDDTGMTAKSSKHHGSGPKVFQAKPADARSHDITFQDCLISEGLDPQRFGALLDEAENITICRTLWADNNSRNPKAKGTIQIVNDVVYNWEVGGMVGGHSAADWHQDYINNLLIAGPNTHARSAFSMYTHTDHVFSVGNQIDLDKNGQLNPREVSPEDFRGNHQGDAPTFVDQPFNHPQVPVTVLPTEQVFQYVAANAGDSLHRDAVDKRVIAQLRSLGKTGSIIHQEKDVGGLEGVEMVAAQKAPVDSDGDGIPDAWERAHGLDPNSAADGKRVDARSGSTALELYLDSLVAR